MGLRARKKAARRAAITEAAAQLFAEQGYAETTTQQVARAADVAEGTVFRYAGTKPELLLMVINEHLRPLVVAPEASDGTAEGAVMAILGPIVEFAERQPDVAAPFLREVMFGEDGPQRRASLEIVDDLVAQIEDVLRPHETQLRDLSLPEASRWVFSTLVSELLVNVVRQAPRGQRDLRVRLRVLLRGLGISEKS